MTSVHDQVDAIIQDLAPLDSRPRRNAAWDKTATAIVSELEQLHGDPEYQRAFDGCVVLRVVDSPLLFEAMNMLIGIAAVRVPLAYRSLDRLQFADWFFSLVIADARARKGDPDGGEAILEALADRMRLQHPVDSDAALNNDGSATIPSGGLSFGQMATLQGLQASQYPEGKAGRKRQAPKPKGPSRALISDAKMKDTGTMSFEEWAAKHAPDLDMSNHREAKNAYARYDRANAKRLRRRH